jgi:hypothetical protein
MKRKQYLATRDASEGIVEFSAPHRKALIPRLKQRCAERNCNEAHLDVLKGAVFDWIGVARLAQKYERGGWVFRGQALPHPLKPKIFRPATRKYATRDGNPAHSVQDEKRIVDVFMRRSRPYLEHSPEDRIEWLSIAQHHGLPTRLLDWTESFLAAIFFAVQTAGVRGLPVVYAFKHSDYQLLTVDPFKLRGVALYWPPHIASRIPAQQALFTVHGNPKVHFRPPSLEQWLIEPTACFRIKKQLRVCGMTESVLFPGIDGLAGYLEWVYKWPQSMD